MDAKAPARNNYLDWLRVLGILFVFIYHTTRIYNVEDWNVKNAIWYPSVELWNGFATTFMMPLMFVVSGASLFYATRKSGVVKFVKDKVLRLLVPLLAADLIHISIQDYLWAINHGEFNGSFFQFLPQYYRPGGFNLISSHLWYLWFLFLFSLLLYPLLRWLRRGETLSRLNGWLSKGGMIYILALPILLLALLPSEFPLMGSSGGYPYLVYLFFVLYGFLIVSDQRLQERIHALRWISLPVGLALAAGFPLVISRLPNTEEMSAGLILAGMMRFFGGWIAVLGFFGLGMQFLNRRSARLDYANEAVLPFYILHQTVIQAVGFLVLQRLIPEGLEWALIVVVSFAVILLVYEFLVRRGNAMRFLFGMKRLPAQPQVGIVEPQLGAPGAG